MYQAGVKSEPPKGIHESWEGVETVVEEIVPEEPGHSRWADALHTASWPEAGVGRQIFPRKAF